MLDFELLGFREEDSFAKEYANALKEIDPKVSMTFRSSDSDATFIKTITEAVNKGDAERRKALCQHMHQYLLDHRGSVKRWPESINYFVSYSFKKDPTHSKFYFNYFGADYRYDPEVKGIVPESVRNVYRNAYEYDKPEPKADFTAAAEAQCADLYADEVSKSLGALICARGELDDANAVCIGRWAGLFGLLMSLLVAVLIGAACIHPIHAIHYEATSELIPYLNGILNDADIPGWLRLVGTVLLYIPMFLIYLLNAVCKILFPLMEMLYGLSLSAYIIGCAAAVVAAVILVIILNHFFPISKLFKLAHKRQCKQALKQAEAASKAAIEKQNRMQKKFRAGNHFAEAKRKDAEALQAYQADKAWNEAFAEKWQRAWFSYLRSHTAVGIDSL